MKFVTIKHSDEEIASLSDNGTIQLNCAGTLIEDNITVHFTKDLTEWDGSFVNPPVKPTNLTPSATYTGEEISNGYTCPEHVTMSGQSSGRDPGTYSATYTVESGLCWSDGTTGAVTVTLTIYEFPGLKFTANTAGSTVQFPQTFEYSSDGINWSVASTSTPITLENEGDKIFVRNGYVGTLDEEFGTFRMTGSISASGNVMSLVDNSCESITIPVEYCFMDLFYNCTALTTAPELPATTLTVDCYFGMFHHCTSLTTAPALPATQLAVECYLQMFEGCTSLAVAPDLPAMRLTQNCYLDMFADCTSLVSAPALPATQLDVCCYESMFYRCTSLVNAPKLPATQLAVGCYNLMFAACTSLTTAPELSATTLASDCYRAMFNGCTALIVSDTSGEGYDKAWTIPTSGTFSNTYAQTDMFTDCATGSGRASDNMTGESGQSYTYYTQNEPVTFQSNQETSNKDLTEVEE